MLNMQAMQRTMPTSTSYAQSMPVSSVRMYRLPRQSVGKARSPQVNICTAHRRQNCGPGSRYGPRWGFFNNMAAGPSAVQLEEMIKEFARQFGNSPYSGATSGSGNSSGSSSSAPAGYLPIDLEEQETYYTLTADVPGLQKADLKISVNQNERTLKIVGERQRSSDQQSEPQADSQPQYRKQFERSMGKFSRTLVLDKDADLSAVSARVDKGVLVISIQKKDLAKDEEEIRVNID